MLKHQSVDYRDNDYIQVNRAQELAFTPWSIEVNAKVRRHDLCYICHHLRTMSLFPPTETRKPRAIGRLCASVVLNVLGPLHASYLEKLEVTCRISVFSRTHRVQHSQHCHYGYNISKHLSPVRTSSSVTQICQQEA